MRNDNLIKCSKCLKSKPKREVSRINKVNICKKCLREKRKEKREKIKRDVLGIRKRSDLEKEWKKKREEKEKEKNKVVLPGLKKINKRKTVKGMTLPKSDGKILYSLLIKRGLSSDEANERISELRKDMEERKEKIRKGLKGKTEKEINNKFKEEFAKMIQEEKK